MKRATKQDFNNFRRILAYVRPWKLRYGAGLALRSVDDYVRSAVLSLITGELLAAAQLGDLTRVGYLAATRLPLFVAYMLLAGAGIILCNNAGSRATAALRTDLYDRMLHQPSHGEIQQHSGKMLSRLNNDVSYAGRLFSQAIVRPVALVCSFVLGVATVWAVSWQSALAMVGLGLLMLLVNVLFVDPGRKRFTARHQTMAGTVTDMSDLLAGAETVRIYNNGSGLLHRYVDACHTLFHSSMSAFRMRTLQNTLGQIQAALILACSLGLGFWLFHSGQIPLSVLPTLWWMGDLVVWPLANIGNYLGDIQRQLTGATRVVEFLDLPSEKQEHPGSARFSKVAGAPAVQAHGLGFCYGDRRLFSGKELTVAQGEICAVTGRSGCGKSTFLRMLMGLEAYEGSLLLFGRELKELSLEEIRRQSSFVSQDSLLFDGTIYSNILMGNPAAGREEVLQAVRDADLEEFVSSLPQGLDTPVGERGASLSGGQKQRVAMARALIKQAPLLILDEPTAALDSVTEQYIGRTLEHLRGKCTVLVVSHSPALTAHADHVIHFENPVQSSKTDEVIRAPLKQPVL